MSDREHMGEPIPGLPERPPAGERVLWQGAPRWQTVARRTFHVRKAAIYFAVLVAWRGIYSAMQGQDILAAIQSTTVFVGLSAAALGLLLLIAWLTARTTIYTITSERVVMRFGIAMQMAVNLPFKLIRSAAVKTYGDGTGDLPLELPPGERVSYIVMWPNVRPWSLGNAQPMLRGVDDAANVAQMLSRALAGEAVTPMTSGQTLRPTGFLAGGRQTAS
jgi:hypothetical protein